MTMSWPEGWIEAAWPDAPRLRGVFSGRRGGGSDAPWDGCNLGSHVGDAPAAVAANRELLARRLGGARVAFLEQVHGTVVVDLDAWDGATPPRADAAVTTRPGLAACVLVADCLPVLFAAPDAAGVAAAHAGWRGLVGGVLENTVGLLCAKAGCAPRQLQAWLGPAIGPCCFEVGAEVRAAFVHADSGAVAGFAPGAPGKWQADLFALARRRLRAAGLPAAALHGGGVCTRCGDHFFSFRRAPVTGRQAGLCWIEP
jgi:YfiH family protein